MLKHFRPILFTIAMPFTKCTNKKTLLYFVFEFLAIILLVAGNLNFVLYSIRYVEGCQPPNSFHNNNKKQVEV